MTSLSDHLDCLHTDADWAKIRAGQDPDHNLCQRAPMTLEELRQRGNLPENYPTEAAPS